MRPVLALALLAVVVTAGCAGPADGGATEPTATTATQIPERATTATETATAELPTTETRTTETEPTETLPGTDSEPQKGDQFLSVMELNESEAMAWNSSKRAAFENLSAERQQVVREAVECECNIELDGEFDFNDKDRIEMVEYRGTYFFLRVAIV